MNTRQQFKNIHLNENLIVIIVGKNSMAIFTNSLLFVKDNSDAKIVKCIKKFKSNGKTPAFPGKRIIVSVRKRTFSRSILKHKLYHALLLTSSKKRLRFNGMLVKFDLNTCFLINEDGSLVGTNVDGLVSLETLANQFTLKTDYYKVIPNWRKQV